MTAEHRPARPEDHRRRVLLATVVAVLALALIVGGGLLIVRPLVTSVPVATTTTTAEATDFPPGSGTEAVTVDVPEGATADQLAQALLDAGIVKTAGAFTAAYAGHGDVTIPAGTYTLYRQMPAADALATLLDPASRTSVQITVAAGGEAAGVYERLATALGVTRADVDAAAAQVAATLPEAAGSLEGFLEPGIYEIAPGEGAADVLTAMAAKTIATLDAAGVAADQRRDTLIKASIVQAEARRAEDMPQIAEVIDNRLAGCDDTRALGAYSPYVYNLGRPAGKITAAELADRTNPWNTTLHEGLPPGPINSPGPEALAAVLSPAGGGLCYWITVNLETGETKFATTAAEHEKNQAEFRAWRDTWLAEHPSEAPPDPGNGN